MSTNPDDVTPPGWTINVQFETPQGASTPPPNIPFLTDKMLAAVAKAAIPDKPREPLAGETGQALQTIFTRADKLDEGRSKEVARAAYDIAEAMMAERARRSAR
jgi:hypothetical protein